MCKTMSGKTILDGRRLYGNGQKYKKLFFSAPERPRTVSNAFLECMYFVKMKGLYGRTSRI